MSIQALLISVAVTLVTVGVTFFYFRNRMNKTEKKVDLMFQLIQEHERNSKISQQMQMQQMYSMSNENKENLINISDDEDNYESDDSEVVSDDENDLEENKLVIKDENDSLVDTVKTISLSLDGAETFNKETLDIQNNNENDNNQDVSSETSELDSLTVNNTDNENSDVDSNDDGTLNNFVVTKKHSNKTTNSDTDSLDEELSDNEEQTLDTPSINYAKLSKNQLKQLAQEKGLAGYNKLTKGGLVELLNATP
jgi:hypothetical protein